MVYVNLALILVAGYLAGSIPTAIWLGRLRHGTDIREHGSGNAGAANVFRVFGWRTALIVVSVDIGKGLLPTLYAAHLMMVATEIPAIYLQLMAGLAAIAGHIWTLFAGFRGGKGVATAAGVFLALAPYTTLLCILVYALVVARTRISSTGSLCAILTMPTVLLIARFGFGRTVETPLLVLALTIVPFFLFTHRANIARLFKGAENKLG